MIQKITINFRFKPIGFGFKLFSLFYVIFVFGQIIIQILFEICIKYVNYTGIAFINFLISFVFSFIYRCSLFLIIQTHQLASGNQNLTTVLLGTAIRRALE